MLILASTSRYRRELLQRLRLPFQAVAPQVDETPLPLETPLDRAQRLALAKATAVRRSDDSATIVGSDQVAVCKGRVLGKPGDLARCREQLHWLSGSAAIFYTAVAVLDRRAAQASQSVDTTTIYFRTLGDEEIERYMAAEQPFDCAGGFRAEALGITLFARIVSEDPTALIGLPLMALARTLRQLGYELP